MINLGINSACDEALYQASKSKTTFVVFFHQQFSLYRVRMLNPTLTRLALTLLNIAFSVSKLYTSVAYCIIFAINTAAHSYPKKHELRGKDLNDHHQRPARWKKCDRDR